MNSRAVLVTCVLILSALAMFPLLPLSSTQSVTATTSTTFVAYSQTLTAYSTLTSWSSPNWVVLPSSYVNGGLPISSDSPLVWCGSGSRNRTDVYPFYYEFMLFQARSGQNITLTLSSNRPLFFEITRFPDFNYWRQTVHHVGAQCLVIPHALVSQRTTSFNQTWLAPQDGVYVFAFISPFEEVPETQVSFAASEPELVTQAVSTTLMNFSTEFTTMLYTAAAARQEQPVLSLGAILAIALAIGAVAIGGLLARRKILAR
jgi:hypothetical protein